MSRVFVAGIASFALLVCSGLMVSTEQAQAGSPQGLRWRWRSVGPQEGLWRWRSVGSSACSQERLRLSSTACAPAPSCEPACAPARVVHLLAPALHPCARHQLAAVHCRQQLWLLGTSTSEQLWLLSTSCQQWVAAAVVAVSCQQRMQQLWWFGCNLGLHQLQQHR